MVCVFSILVMVSKRVPQMQRHFHSIYIQNWSRLYLEKYIVYNRCTFLIQVHIYTVFDFISLNTLIFREQSSYQNVNEFYPREQLLILKICFEIFYNTLTFHSRFLTEIYFVFFKSFHEVLRNFEKSNNLVSFLNNLDWSIVPKPLFCLKISLLRFRTFINYRVQTRHLN